ncbi:MAG: SHOCT domain-containing protein [Burkholderiales bacterium]|nr:SHOCT domain-containing protein [Burkholderiales bacterium]
MIGGLGFGLVILVSIIVIAVWLWSNPRCTDKVVGKDALEILKERYARGEIDKSTFLEQKRELES